MQYIDADPFGQPDLHARHRFGDHHVKLVVVNILRHHKAAEPDGRECQNRADRRQAVQQGNPDKAPRRPVPADRGRNQHYAQQQQEQQQLKKVRADRVPQSQFYDCPEWFHLRLPSRSLSLAFASSNFLFSCSAFFSATGSSAAAGAAFGSSVRASSVLETS